MGGTNSVAVSAALFFRLSLVSKVPYLLHSCSLAVCSGRWLLSSTYTHCVAATPILARMVSFFLHTHLRSAADYGYLHLPVRACLLRIVRFVSLVLPRPECGLPHYLEFVFVVATLDDCEQVLLQWVFDRQILCGARLSVARQWHVW